MMKYGKEEGANLMHCGKVYGQILLPFPSHNASFWDLQYALSQKHFNFKCSQNYKVLAIIYRATLS